MFSYNKSFNIELVFKNDYLNIRYCKEPSFLISEWSGVLDAARAKEGCMLVLEHVKKHPTARLLNNNQQVTGHYPGAIDWAGKIWISSLYDAGLRYFAWVYSPEFYTQVGTDEIISMSSKVTINTFFDIVTAMDWLLSQPDKS